MWCVPAAPWCLTARRAAIRTAASSPIGGSSMPAPACWELVRWRSPVPTRRAPASPHRRCGRCCSSPSRSPTTSAGRAVTPSRRRRPGRRRGRKSRPRRWSRPAQRSRSTPPASRDPYGSVAACEWEQIGGPPVSLGGGDAARPASTAPADNAARRFRLTVQDDAGLGAPRRVGDRGATARGGDSDQAHQEAAIPQSVRTTKANQLAPVQGQDLLHLEELRVGHFASFSKVR